MAQQTPAAAEAREGAVGSCCTGPCVSPGDAARASPTSSLAFSLPRSSPWFGVEFFPSPPLPASNRPLASPRTPRSSPQQEKSFQKSIWSRFKGIKRQRLVACSNS